VRKASLIAAEIGRRSLADVGKTLRLQGETVKCIGRLHYLVKSKSEGGWHCVDLEPVGIEWPEGGCTCRGYTTRKDCRHVRVIRKHLGIT
jgi:hypothetical protein